MANTPQNSNARVTNARILEKLESMDDRLSKMEDKMDGAIEHTTRCAERWEQHRNTHETMGKRIDKAESSLGWKSALAASFAAGAAAIGAWVKQ